MPRKSSSANALKRSGSNVRRTIGANIKARRLAMDWNQQDLADRFGVSRSAVSQYEIGTGEVNAGDLPRLAGILGLTLLDFYKPPSRGYAPAPESTDPARPSRAAGGRGTAAVPAWDGSREPDGQPESEAGGGTHMPEGSGSDVELLRGLTAQDVFAPTKPGWPPAAPPDGPGSASGGGGLEADTLEADTLEMTELFAAMTPLERRTSMRVASALRGTLGG